jgi:hypothetical protein
MAASFWAAFLFSLQLEMIWSQSAVKLFRLLI